MGGNKRLKNFLNNYDIPHLPYKAKYETKACHHYREMVGPNSSSWRTWWKGNHRTHHRRSTRAGKS